MKQLLTSFYYRYLAPKCIVLMYHRVAVPPSDVWEIAVSPQNFEAHLKVLQAHGNVLPLSEMIRRLRQGKVPNKAIALTFDDAYADNIDMALPLLEGYKLPATFFVTSIKKGPFWWDALEQTLLTAEQLPAVIKLPDNGSEFHFGPEATLSTQMRQLHAAWKPFDGEAPTRRAQLYLQLWQQMLSMEPGKQQDFLQQLQQQNGITITTPNEVATEQQLQALKKHPLIEIGAHTAQHVALSMHTAAFQKEQVEQNKKDLELFYNQSIRTLAYPYGRYNADSIEAAANLGFDAAFTTNPQLLNKRSHPFQLGRFQVANWSADVFQQKLHAWLRKN